jgi:hypothetical protein
MPLVTEERYWALFYMPLYTSFTQFAECTSRDCKWNGIKKKIVSRENRAKTGCFISELLKCPWQNGSWFSRMMPSFGVLPEAVFLFIFFREMRTSRNAGCMFGLPLGPSIYYLILYTPLPHTHTRALYRPYCLAFQSSSWTARGVRYGRKGSAALTMRHPSIRNSLH